MNTGVTGTPYESGPVSIEGESGALDNVLTLNPNDGRWPAVLRWKDDATYTFTNVKVRQVSPGQFEVISAEAGPQDEQGGAEDQAAERAVQKTTPTGDYPNPGVANLEM